ncbi:putative mitochondrial hypothetical protein [Leptomonas pyrrhocoris]|uniref:NADH dehydrogenase [ubiquinone] 1 beta subcomplex subunit 7 n=1 Tax=Leptomonas pyrrhocoris TaxID=157538 RepID=A0A0N0VGN6_LEPPY|nr:putative mitochondrial hypothetical protein [Leptomonas pyrrhocoris]XP_015662114.1 putative mitochondrial hypothetical protein [Leptomonas pyrrhocoris]KPA83674.1 putative mitochondrial hypothetical protein [Leptomonas pyrrhocoris]KPA83675.1 putative mitochondrial hypothetical protein [Leptomonas pyrrhocoris]|eukprot:XP_015662113.1 putative mitochondrial hypothetical protein [Leptomonas pyrrhocoris]
MGAKGSRNVAAADAASRFGNTIDDEAELDSGVTPDASLSSDVSTPEETAAKRKAYANLRSPYAVQQRQGKSKMNGTPSDATTQTHHANLIEQIYNEDFDTIDHIQAMRLPPMVTQQLKNAVRDEAERRCAETEKAMARCLQDKMWTSWKCQKERDTYFYCVEDVEKENLLPDPNNPGKTDMLTAFRWKYNLGVFHGEIIGRNNIMKEIWREHYPDRELPHPWVKDV